MESHITGFVIAIVCLIILSAFFSATETAFTSLNRAKLKSLEYKGKKRKRMEQVLKLEDNYDKLLTTTLIGNNIANIAMAAIGTVLFVELYGKYGPTVATVVITIVVLVFAEISPKSIAKEKPEAFSMFLTPPIRIFMIIFAPLNFLFTKWKQRLSKIFRLSKDRTITEDELITIVEEAQGGGSIDNEQGELIQNAIEFNERIAEDVITPRIDMIAIDVDLPKEEIADLFKKTGFSRFPVYEEDVDKIIGTLNQKDFHNYIAGTQKAISDYVKPVVFVPGAIKISVLLKKMQQMKTHIAVIIDEYGGTEGLVTMEDIIEELVGEIYDEHDAVMLQEIIPLQNGSFRIKCSANIEKVFDYFNIHQEMTAQTVNGWVVKELDKMPKRNDTFTYEAGNKALKVRVTKADDRRALEINLIVEEILQTEEEKGEEI